VTYLEFHLIFNLPLLLALGWMVRKKFTAVHVRWIAVVILIVVAFTFPWDDWAVGRKIWEFDDSRVVMRVSHLPIEEVLFFVMEAVAVCLLTIWALPVPKRRS
jgi:lycopene cyclase domain-containing protein